MSFPPDVFVTHCREGHVPEVIQGLKNPLIKQHRWSLVKGVVVAAVAGHVPIATEVLKHLEEDKGLLHECLLELSRKATPQTVSRVLDKVPVQDTRSLWRTLLLMSAKTDRFEMVEMLLSHALCKDDFLPGKKVLLASKDPKIQHTLLQRYIDLDKMNHVVKEMKQTPAQSLFPWIRLLCQNLEIFRPFYDEVFSSSCRFSHRLDVDASKGRIPPEWLSIIQKEMLEWELKNISSSAVSVKRRM